MVKCSESDCIEEAEFVVWVLEHKDAWTFRCKHHLIWLLQTSDYTVDQVTRASAFERMGFL